VTHFQSLDAGMDRMDRMVVAWDVVVYFVDAEPSKNDANASSIWVYCAKSLSYSKFKCCVFDSLWILQYC